MITLREIEKRIVLSRLARYKGNRRKCADSLGIAVRTLQRMLKKWGVNK